MVEGNSGESQDSKPAREVYTAYICARCDTDFGINDIGYMLKTGTYPMVCPVCGCAVFHVYHIVDDREILGVKERGINYHPPIVTDTRSHLGDDTDENTETEW